MRDDLATAYNWSAQLAEVKSAEAEDDIFNRWLRTACELVAQQWPVIERVAAELLEVGTLTGEDLRARYGPMIEELARSPSP